MDRLAQFLHQEHPKQILDVATGAGNYIQMLTRLYDDYDRIVGVDSLSYAINSAKKSFQENDRIQFECMNASNLSFADEMFDLVVLSNSLHHLEHKEDIFKEMERVLKPGGFLIVSEMISNDLDERQMGHLKLHHFAAEVDRFLGDSHEDTYRDDEIVSILQDVSSLTIDSSWSLEFERSKSNSDEEIEWLKQTIDRIVSRVKNPIRKNEFEAKGKDVKAYIETHGFDSATTLVVVMRK